ncbi:putative filaggrin-2-like isoform X2 [Apostichopus japonicus]|uniref:Putative filaggrin-2-like isoform X2 n=1 Tax=Stichopus japonicus TaxID=307972 RepID=A0A2G8KT76_STIJA|nr:putative filaggrin-2-like isoform X2 [Apostichopus japonicus]
MSKAQNVMKKTFAPLNGLPLDGKRLTMRHNENLVAESKGRFPNSSREGLFQKGELSSTDPTNVQRFGSNVGINKKSIDSQEGMKTEDYNKSRVPPEINQGRIKESSFVPKAPKGPVNGVKRALTFDKVETISSTKRRPSNTNTSSMQGNYNNAAMNNINKRRLDVTDRAEMEHCNRVARDNTSRASSANRVVMDGANNGSSDHTRRVAVKDNDKPGLQYTSRAAGDHSNEAGRDPSNRAVTVVANNRSSDHTRRVPVKDNDKTGLQYASRVAGDHSNKAGRDPSNRAVTVVANNGLSDHTRRVAVKDNDKTGLQYTSRAAGDHSNKAGRDPSNRAVMNGANNRSSDHTRRVAVKDNDKPGLQYASRAAGDHSNKAGRNPCNRAVTVVANNGLSDHTRRVPVKDNDKIGLQYASRAAGDHSNKAGRDPSNRAVMNGANNGSSDHTRRVAVKDNDKPGLQYASRAAGDHSNKAGRDPCNRAVTVVANNGLSDHTRRVPVKDNDKIGLQYASRTAGDHSNKAGRDPSNRAVMDGANKGSSDHTRRVAVQKNDKTGLQNTSRAAGDHSNKAGRDPSNRAVMDGANKGSSDHTRRVAVQNNDKTGLQYASRAAGDHSNKAGRDPSNRAAMANGNRATKDMSNRAAVNNVDRGVMVHRNRATNNFIDKAAVRQKVRMAMRPSIHATAMDNTNKALRNNISRGKIENSKKGLPLDKDKTKSPKRKTVNQTVESDTIGGGLDKTSSRTPRAMTDKRARYQTIAETTRSKLAVFKREENKPDKTPKKLSTGKNVSVTNGIHGRKELRLPTIKEDDTGSGCGGKLPMNKVVGEKQGPKRTRESNTTDEAGYDVVGTTDCSAAVNGKVVSRKNFTTPRGALTSRNEKKKKYPNGKIDPSVLDSLPTEIQSEVLPESRLGLKNSSDVSDDDRKTKHFDPNQASTSTGITSKLDQEVLQNLPADILQEVVESERCRLKLAQSTPIGGTNQTLGARTAGKRNIPEAFNMKEFAFKKKKCDRKLKIGVKIATDPSTDSLINTNDRKSRHELSTNDDMNIHNFIKEDQHSDEYAETELDPSVIEERETVKSEVVAAEAEKKKISLGGAFTIEDVKNMMKQWMELFASPLDEDISHVVHFMRSHILDQNLEMVFQLLRAFKRMVSTGDSQDWRNAYITVKERIQTTVGHIYGSSLKLDEDL